VQESVAAKLTQEIADAYEHNCERIAARQSNRYRRDYCRGNWSVSTVGQQGAPKAQRAGSLRPVLPPRIILQTDLLSNVHPTSIVAQQEIFGPVWP